jgi:hypothetical protein
MLAVAVVAILAMTPSPPRSYAAAHLTAQTSNMGGVTVVVKPKAVGANAAAWEFEVTMDTHTKPLSEDLAKVAVLIDDSSRRHAPAAWQGDPPGGHHRKGTLRFADPPLAAKTIELQISAVGGAGPRSFRWTLN